MEAAGENNSLRALLEQERENSNKGTLAIQEATAVIDNLKDTLEKERQHSKTGISEAAEIIDRLKKALESALEINRLKDELEQESQNLKKSGQLFLNLTF